MTTQQLIIAGSVAVGAYFLIKSKNALSSTPAYPGYTITYPAGSPVLTPTAVASPAAVPGTSPTGISTTGGGIAYNSGNLAVEVGFDTLKNLGTSIYNAIFGGEKPTITPSNKLTSQLINSTIYSA